MAEDSAPSAGGGSGKKMMIVIVLAVVAVVAAVFITLKLAGGGGGGEGGGEEHSQKALDTAEVVEPAALYVPFTPAFVVNFQGRGRARYLQLTVEVLTYDAKVVELLTQHMPVIRNNLLLLFSSQDQEQLRSMEGKEKLRAQALAEVQKVLEEKTGDIGIEALYFTSFVMQ